jgi:hypothetical protein
VRFCTLVWPCSSVTVFASIVFQTTSPSMQMLIVNAKKAAITTGATWLLDSVLVADAWPDILRAINDKQIRKTHRREVLYRIIRSDAATAAMP